MGRLMALDVGDRRIGVAVSDPLGLFARPVETVARRGDGEDLARISALVAEWGIDRLVIGLPLLPSGDRGEQARSVEAYVEALACVVDVPTELWDESFTTLEAEARSRANGRGCAGKDRIDALAAAVILEEWLAAHDGAPREPADAVPRQAGSFRDADAARPADAAPRWRRGGGS